MARALTVALVLAWVLSSNELQARESSSDQPTPPKHPSPVASSFRRDPVERRDLTGLLGPRICSDRPSDPQALWQLGIFDAQLEGVLFSAKTPARDILLAKAQKRSRLLARINHLGGYAAGVCPDGTKAWAVAVPSPEPIVPPFRDQKLALPKAALKARCASFRVDFAAAGGGSPKRVAIGRQNFVDTAIMAPGVVSVSCQPRAPSWQGPVLWALVPVNQDFDAKMPVAPRTAEKISFSDGLMHWIGQIRAKEGLSPLIGHPDLHHYAELLAIDGSLRHNRTQQALVTQKLHGTTTSPLGEDRVRARDLGTMAWLLWNSPRHRGLLLDPAATTIGIGLKGLGSETLAVLLTGKTTHKSTVLRPDRKPRQSLR